MCILCHVVFILFFVLYTSLYNFNLYPLLLFLLKTFCAETKLTVADIFQPRFLWFTKYSYSTLGRIMYPTPLPCWHGNTVVWWNRRTCTCLYIYCVNKSGALLCCLSTLMFLGNHHNCFASQGVQPQTIWHLVSAHRLWYFFNLILHVSWLLIKEMLFFSGCYCGCRVKCINHMYFTYMQLLYSAFLNTWAMHLTLFKCSNLNFGKKLLKMTFPDKQGPLSCSFIDVVFTEYTFFQLAYSHIMYVNSNLVNHSKYYCWLFLTTKDGLTEWVAFISQHLVACECFWVFMLF